MRNPELLDTDEEFPAIYIGDNAKETPGILQAVAPANALEPRGMVLLNASEELTAVIENIINHTSPGEKSEYTQEQSAGLPPSAEAGWSKRGSDDAQKRLTQEDWDELYQAIGRSGGGDSPIQALATSHQMSFQEFIEKTRHARQQPTTTRNHSAVVA